MKCNIIGESNEVDIVLNDEIMNALLDSGSMITTFCKKRYNLLLDKPEFQKLSTLGLEISVADGSILQFKGYRECIISLLDIELLVPIVIVPETEFNKNCPVIVGTNILRICRDYYSHTLGQLHVPDAWQLAIDSLQCKSFCVKITTKQNITQEPYQSLVVNGVVKGDDKNVSTVVTESSESNA